MHKIQKLFRKLLFNSDGEIVIFQWPNLPLFIWFSTMVASKIIQEGKFKLFVELVSLVSIVCWSILEIFYGVNYFRRFIGLVILLVVVVSGVFI